MKKLNNTDVQSLIVAAIITTMALIVTQHLKSRTNTTEIHRLADIRISEQVEVTTSHLEKLKQEEQKQVEAEEAKAKEVAKAAEAQAQATQEATETASEPEPVVEPTPTQTLDPGYQVSPQAIMDAAGIAQIDRVAVNFIISSESGWRPYAWNNSGSGAYGLCQALPAGKMADAGADWETNPVTQLRWCASYAQGRYGGWIQAANFWRGNLWW